VTTGGHHSEYNPCIVPGQGHNRAQSDIDKKVSTEFRFLCPKGCGGSSPPSPTAVTCGLMTGRRRTVRSDQVADRLSGVLRCELGCREVMVPSWGVVARQMVPPWALTIACAMGSPSPDPVRVRLVSARQNRSKARVASSAVMPGPVSRIRGRNSLTLA
jgi:hypothetical protein